MWPMTPREYTGKDAKDLVERAEEAGFSILRIADLCQVSEDTVWAWKDGRCRAVRRKSMAGLERLHVEIRGRRRR